MNGKPEVELRYPTGYSLGDYEIRKFLDSGNRTDVYLARHLRLENEVALKVVRRDGAQTWQEQYALAMCRLRHPNIVRVHSADRLEDHPVIVTDYFKGRTLSQILGEKGRLTLEEALRVASCVAEVLDYVHTLELKGLPILAHLDLTPSNIFIDFNGTIKISDFGMVQAMGAPVPLPPDTPAPSAYLAPEQLEGKPSPQSDLWAAGVLLFEMVLGRTPPCGIYPEEQTSSADAQDSGLGPDFASLPDPLKHIIFRCLHRNPEERFASAAQLASALAEACSALGLLKCLKCGEPMPPESEVCPECIFAEVRESLSQRQRRTSRGSRTPRSVVARRWYAALALLTVAALLYGGYRLWKSWQPDQVAQQPKVESSPPAAGREQRADTRTAAPEIPQAGAPGESREVRPWMLAAASNEWQRFPDLERSPDGSFEDRIGRLKKFIGSYPGTPESLEAKERLRLLEIEGRAFRATEDFEGRPDSKTCAILTRWKDFYTLQTSGLRRDYAWDRIQYWTKRVEDYTGYADLTVHSARRLPAADFSLLGGGHPDPYFLLLDGDRVLYRSRTFTDDSSPVWQESVRIYIRKGMEFHFDIWDDDLFGHEMLAHLNLTPFPVDGPFQVSDGIVSVSLEIHRDK